jgi:hypothetical protein
MRASASELDGIERLGSIASSLGRPALLRKPVGRRPFAYKSIHRRAGREHRAEASDQTNRTSVFIHFWIFKVQAESVV